MRPLLFFAAIFFVLFIPNSVLGQNEEVQEVKAVIDRLFEGMLESDSSMVADTFIEEPIMQTVISSSEQGAFIKGGEFKKFLSDINNAQEGLLNEKLSGYEIKADGELASAWTPYKFYIGEKFSHCGVNSFQLVKMDEGWKIFHIVDTRRKNGCIES